ncbi:MAG: beta-galactosidase, partial [Oscillospiraceae bacterium]|nr:beta-galactosidase [Oscillospiraceae bacterium]
SYGKINCTAKTDLFSVLDKISTPVKSNFPLTMEEIGQNYGYILYRTQVKDNETVKEIRLEGARDRVQAYHNGELVHTFFAENMWEKAELSDRNSGGTVDLLCENIGRENFGTGLENQRKGISGGVKINDHRQFGYEIYPLPLDEKQLEKLDFDCGYSEGVSAFYRFDFEVDEACDTFLDTDGFGKGAAFINGFNLGRFWEIGPQKRLYVPAPLLNKGKNTIIVFETEGKSADSISLCGEADLG